MRKIINLNNPILVILILLTSFMLLSTYVHGEGLSDESKVLLTVTSFLFGFYINNLISQARSRHTKIVESLREEGGYLKAIYFMTKSIFPNETTSEVRESIDLYLIANQDYRRVDFSKTSKSFENLFTTIMKIEAVNKQQDVAWGHLVRIVGEISKARNRIESIAKERVSSFEWITLLTLLNLTVFFVFSLNGGGAVPVIVTSFIATALFTLPIILLSLDSLRWKEEQLFWVPIQELFEGLTLLPYYPRPLIDQGRINLSTVKIYRLAEYPNPYPDLEGKTVTTITQHQTSTQ